MAVVPPGNKQIGNYLTTGVVNLGNSAVLLASAGFAIAKNDSALNSYVEPFRAQIGSVNLAILVNQGSSAALPAAALFAVVKKTPPPTGAVLAAASFAVVKYDLTSYTLSLPQPISIGATSVTGIVNLGKSATMPAAVLYAVVHKYQDRDESIIHGINLS